MPVLGYTLYRGRSAIDGKPIVLIATLKTKNSKTGDVIQTWILRRDKQALDAYYTGEDFSVCGNCAHRTGGSCYVLVGHAPNNISRSYAKGNYPYLPVSQWKSVFGDKVVRLGAYGDPAMLPYHVSKRLADSSKSWVGYTHQWNTDWIDDRYSQLLMASCETELGQIKANALGWSAFTTCGIGDTVDNATQCFAVSHSVTCEDCRRCGGNRGNK